MRPTRSNLQRIAQEWDLAVVLLQTSYRAISYRLCLRFQILFFMLFLQGTNQIDALLYGTNWSNLMVDFHGLQDICTGRALAYLVGNWFVKELSLFLVHVIVSSA